MLNHHISKTNDYFHIMKPTWTVKKRHAPKIRVYWFPAVCHQHINQFIHKPKFLSAG